MRMLFAADLHYTLKQFDWIAAQAEHYDAVVIGGDLLDLSSAVDLDIQIVVLEKYFERLRRVTRLIVSSGNHDGDRRSAADESIAGWIRAASSPQVFVDGDSVDLGGTPNSTVWNLAFHAAMPELGFATSVSGHLFRTTDGGRTWRKLPHEFGETRGLAIAAG